MKVAIVHDWLVSQRGGENVLAAICELFPNADLFTLVYKSGSVDPAIARLNPRPSILQRLPNPIKNYRHFLPLMPFAIERFDMSPYDLIISSSHCVAKGVRKRKDAFHLSYVHAPMRYMWDRFDEYFGRGKYSLPVRMAARALRPFLQKWDQKSALRVDSFLANSNFIASKIKEYYGRESKVVYPFCDAEVFEKPRKPSDFYLIVTALVPYKRVDLAIDAFNQLGHPLVIVGDGPDRERLGQLAKSNIQFVQPLGRDGLAEMYSKCKALVFPGIEDFGIVPIEAMAAGAPVIAFGEGGALETVTADTGIFFYGHSTEGLKKAVQDFELKNFNEAACRARGREFSKARFQRAFLAALSASPAKISSFLAQSGIAPK